EGGQPVLIGSAQVPGSYHTFLMTRFNTDGTLDAGFGTNGLATPSFTGPTDDTPSALVLQPDGKIVVAGSNGLDFALARFSANGSLDTSFGSAGRVTTDFNHTLDSLSGMALESDGKI